MDSIGASAEGTSVSPGIVAKSQSSSVLFSVMALLSNLVPVCFNHVQRQGW